MALLSKPARRRASLPGYASQNVEIIIEIVAIVTAPKPVKRRRPRPTGAVFDDDVVGDIPPDPFAVSILLPGSCFTNPF